MSDPTPPTPPKRSGTIKKRPVHHAQKTVPSPAPPLIADDQEDQDAPTSSILQTPALPTRLSNEEEDIREESEQVHATSTQFQQSAIPAVSYPRHGVVRFIRFLFLACWSILSFYMLNVGWDLYHEYRLDPSKLANIEEVLASFPLPAPFTDPHTPSWVYRALLLCLLSLLMGCLWATVDIRMELRIRAGIVARNSAHQAPKTSERPAIIQVLIRYLWMIFILVGLCLAVTVRITHFELESLIKPSLSFLSLHVKEIVAGVGLVAGGLTVLAVLYVLLLARKKLWQRLNQLRRAFFPRREQATSFPITSSLPSPGGGESVNTGMQHQEGFIRSEPSPPSQPTSDEIKRWKVQWEAQGQPWRTEPEIDEGRQQVLLEHLATVPDRKQARYPFKNVHLNRADLEWLLARVEIERGSLAWVYDPSLKRIRLDLRGADLRHENLQGMPLIGLAGGLIDDWPEATLEEREEAAIHLEGANLSRADLQGSLLRSAHLEGANLSYARLQQVSLRAAHLEGVNLQLAYFNSASMLHESELGNSKDGFAYLADIRWGETNLAGIDWASIPMLGEELDAHRLQAEAFPTKRARQKEQLERYRLAVRAYRQIATELRVQGLSEEADTFAYRAHQLQRRVLRIQQQRLKFLGSFLLWLITGYGYRPLRSLIIYLLLICGFATAYFLLGPQVGVPLSPLGAIVFSVTSFHGRGFFPGGSPGRIITLDDPLTVVAATEAVFGLLIEISFIATFTQRFFGR